MRLLKISFLINLHLLNKNSKTLKMKLRRKIQKLSKLKVLTQAMKRVSHQKKMLKRNIPRLFLTQVNLICSATHFSNIRYL